MPQGNELVALLEIGELEGCDGLRQRHRFVPRSFELLGQLGELRPDTG